MYTLMGMLVRFNDKSDMISQQLLKIQIINMHVDSTLHDMDMKILLCVIILTLQVMI